MILTDEERERIEHGCWSGPGLGASFDRQKFAAAIERAVAAAVAKKCAEIAASTVCDVHLPTGVRIYGSRVAREIIKEFNLKD